MKNQDELLRRILLNMKYDSRKSLNENNASLKRNLNEACIPLDTKLETYSDSEDGAKNKPRSITYPELGKWGDGNCKCINNNNCLEFKPECCGKLNISVGEVQQGKKELDLVPAKSWTGKIINIPKTAKIRPIPNCKARWEEVANTPPSGGVLEICNQLKDTSQLGIYGFKTVDQCAKAYKKARYDKCVDGGLWGFDYGNDRYGACWQLTFVVGDSAQVYRPEQQVLIGYSLLGDGNATSCGKMWNPYEQPTRKVKKDDIIGAQEVQREKGTPGPNGSPSNSSDETSNPGEFEIYF